MTVKHPLKQILSLVGEQLDSELARPDVRKAFQKVVDCNTMALGAEVCASPRGEERIVPHSCKSRACPSCGQRNNLQWLSECWADLPEIPYSQVVLTMSDVLWPLFKENRHLLNDLPALSAKVLQLWIQRRYQAKPLLAVVLHTFGRDLKFNCHLHILLSQGGLIEDETEWFPSIRLNMKAIMRMCRHAVITFLRTAYRRQLLSTTLSYGAFMKLLDEQYC